MIHVVHVVTRTNIGGPSVILESLLADSSNDIRYTIVRGETDPTEGDYFAGSADDNRFVTIEGLGRSISPLADLRAFVQLVKTLRSLSPDVVHTHMAKAGVVGRLAAWIARVPVRVHTFHGHLLYGYFSPLKTRLIILVERLLKLITTHAVVVGSAVRTDLIGAGIITEKNSEMIPPGIPETPVGVIPDRCGVPPEKLIVGFVGRLVPIKRPDRFVELAKKITGSRNDVEFLIVGDGPLGEVLREQAASIPSLHLVGWRRDTTSIMKALDILVLCSDNEGIPLVLIEASQLGVPIVATNVGSVHDVVLSNKNGILVGPRTDEVVTAVNRLLDNRKLQLDLREFSKTFGSTAFVSTHCQRRHAEMYKRLCGPY